MLVANHRKEGNELCKQSPRLNEEPLLIKDKSILYTSLQEIVKELREKPHERKKTKQPGKRDKPFKQPTEQKAIFQPLPIDPLLRLKWGLALLGEEKAKEHLAWIQARFNIESH